MNLYSAKSLSFWNLLRQTFRGYPIVLKSTWFLILISALINPANIFSTKINNSHINGFVILLIVIIFWLVSLFLSAIIFYSSHFAFSGKPVSMQKSIANAKERFLPLLGGCTLIILLAMGAGVIGGLVYFLVYLLTTWLAIGKMISLIFLLVIIYMALFLLILVLPLIILERHTVMESLKKGLELCWNNKWRVLGILFIILLLAITLYGLFGYIISSNNFVEIVLVKIALKFLTYPLFISAILLLLHDSKLQLPILGKRTEL